MKNRLMLAFIVLLVSALVLSACGGGGNTDGNGTGDGEEETALDRPEPPAPFAGMTNPHEGDATAIQAGEQTFQTSCASCHGEDGRGGGPAAASLDPKPADLAENEDSFGDDYMMWRISEGGNMPPFNSAMPAWKGALTEDQIWQTIAYIRQLEE